jgi:hypothetical protein
MKRSITKPTSRYQHPGGHDKSPEAPTTKSLPMLTSDGWCTCHGAEIAPDFGC